MVLPDTNTLLSQIWKPSIFERHLIWLPQQKLGYIRIPKAANSSIRFRLAETFELTDDRGLLPSSDRFWSRQDREKAINLTLRDYVSRDDRDGAWLFTFVRNPIARLYSCWNNKVIENTDLSRAFSRMGVRLGMGFPEFVQTVCDTPDERADIHVRSQVSMMMHEGQFLPHFVGRVERAEADWEHVRFETRLRGGDLGPLAHVNVRLGDKTALLEQIPLQVRRQICNRYAQDFRLFYPEVWQDIMG